MNKEKLLLLLIIAVGFWLRLYHFNSPVADWHSWRQVDTSAVSRNFVKEGFDILHPKFDDLSMGVSLLDNPKGLRYVEFPLYNIVQALLYKNSHQYVLEQWGRIVTIISQETSIVFIFLIVKMFTNARAGLIAAAFFAFIPFNIYYGRVILPDSSMVAALLSSFYFFAKYISFKKYKYFLISGFLLAISFLLKPYALFFVLPFIAISFEKLGGFGILKNKKLWTFAAFSILPLILWRWWISHYPEGIPQNSWLFNGTNIRFKGAFFQWIFADRISRLILGYYGLPFVVLGILSRQKKEGLIYWAFLSSSIVYLFVMATGNVQHDYYQILIIPTLAIFFGKGADFILNLSNEFLNKITAYVTASVCFLFMVMFGWFVVRDYYTLQHIHVYQVGVLADQILPKDAKVVAPYGGDTTFLYYVNRKGWPVVDRPFKDLVKAGAKYIVFADPTKDEFHLSTLYPVFSQGTDYVIFDISHPLVPGKY